MAIKTIQIILAIALVGALVSAGRNVYRRLPDDSAGNASVGKDGAREIPVTIVLGDSASPVNSTVEVYALDFAALQRDYDASPLVQKQFDAFLRRRLRDLEPVRARFDENRRALVNLNFGNWWANARAEMPDGENIEWRIPINVTRPGQTVELTTENAYEKTKKF
jgi:hypothetical protein